MRFTFLVLTFSLFALQCYAQNNRVNLSDILRQAASETFEDELLIDSKLVNLDDVSELLSTLEKDENNRSLIPNSIHFENCQFEQGLILHDLNIPSLSITNSDIHFMELADVTLANFYFEKNTVTGALLIISSIIDDPNISNSEIGTVIELMDNQIRGSFEMGDLIVNEIYIENSVIALNPGSWFNNYVFGESSNYDLHLVENNFLGDTTSAVILNGDYLNLYIEKNDFHPNVYLSKSGVDERFLMAENHFYESISFEDFLFSEIRNEIYWDQLSGYRLAYSVSGVIYKAKNDEELDDDIRFKNLISNYKTLHNIFLARGDLESANACYDEMKELQARKLRHIYQEKGTFANFFRWQLNRLLKVYTNHGTDPALAVVISFYVILIFAFLYLFFPSEWDKPVEKITGFQVKVNKQNVNLLKVYFIHFINAITLSINSFVTLGFGSIPTKGFARYLCIIEGFLGWFLLSIFTVALINQVLA